MQLKPTLETAQHCTRHRTCVCTGVIDPPKAWNRAYTSQPRRTTPLSSRHHRSPVAIKANEPYAMSVHHTRHQKCTTHPSTKTHGNTASSPTAHTNSTRSSIARRYSSLHRKSCPPRTRRTRVGRNQTGSRGCSCRPNQTRLQYMTAERVFPKGRVFARGYCKWGGGCDRFGNICLEKIDQNGHGCNEDERLPINISALGTLWSPMWIADEPTHDPTLCCARWRMVCIVRSVFGAAWTRFRPCPVSRKRYGTLSESKSCSARDHNRNMSRQCECLCEEL